MLDGKTWRRVGLGAAAVLAGVLLAAVVVAGQGPNFEASKTGPIFAEQGEVITYTIDVANTGDPVTDAVLRDPLPDFITFVTCTYRYRGVDYPCTPPVLWTLDFATPETVRTELAVRVNAGTPNFPLVNEATLTWAGVDWPVGPVTTTVNPPYHVYLPLVALRVGG